jgi:hypothetical protein
MWPTPENILISIFHGVRHKSSLLMNAIICYQLKRMQPLPVMKDVGSHPSQGLTSVNHYFVVSFATICKSQN